VEFVRCVAMCGKKNIFFCLTFKKPLHVFFSGKKLSSVWTFFSARSFLKILLVHLLTRVVKTVYGPDGSTVPGWVWCSSAGR